MSDDDLLGAMQDALFLISQFQRQFEHLVIGPKFSIIKETESLDAAVTRNLAEIDAAFEAIKSECEDRQFESLEKFKDAFVSYLWARSDFHASVFLPQLNYETAVSEFLDLAPEHHQTLIGIAQNRNTCCRSGRSQSSIKNSVSNLINWASVRFGPSL